MSLYERRYRGLPKTLSAAYAKAARRIAVSSCLLLFMIVLAKVFKACSSCLGQLSDYDALESNHGGFPYEFGPVARSVANRI